MPGMPEYKVFEMFDRRTPSTTLRAIARDLDIPDNTVRRYLTVFDALQEGMDASAVTVNGWSSRKIREVAMLYEKWLSLRRRLELNADFSRDLDAHRKSLFELGQRLSIELEVTETQALSGLYPTEWPSPWSGALPDPPVHALESYYRFPYLRDHLGASFSNEFEELKRALGDLARATQDFRARTGLAVGDDEDRSRFPSEKMNLRELSFGSLYQHVRHIRAGNAGLTDEPTIGPDGLGHFVVSLGGWSHQVAERVAAERIATRLRFALGSASEWPESVVLLELEDRVPLLTSAMRARFLNPEPLRAQLTNYRCFACLDEKV